MSKFKDKAREIRALGEQQRGNFEPTGAPKRLYDYWLRETNSTKGRAIRRGTRRENFCHFWRVVLFWAPLLWSYKALERGAHRRDVQLSLVAAVLAVSLFIALTVPNALEVIVLALIIATGTILASAGILAGVSLALTEEQREEFGLFDRRVAVIFSLLGLPTAVVSYLFTKACILYKTYLAQHTFVIVGTLASALVVSLMVSLALTEGLLFLAFLLGLVVAATVLVAIISKLAGYLVDYLAGRRQMQELIEQEYIEDYFDEHGKLPPPRTREKGRLARFFSGLGDFIILIAQAVRVSKWKICPIVDIKR